MSAPLTFLQLEPREHSISIQIDSSVDIFILESLLLVTIQKHRHCELEHCLPERTHSEGTRHHEHVLISS